MKNSAKVEKKLKTSEEKLKNVDKKRQEKVEKKLRTLILVGKISNT